MKRTGIAAMVMAAAVLSGSLATAEGLDLFNAFTDFDGTLVIQHLNSYHNCCVAIGHEVEIAGFMIFVRETEPVLTGCWCLCYFDVDLEISDLPPGTYSIAYTYDDDSHLYNEDWQTAAFSAIVPDFAPGPDAPESVSRVSECHNGHSTEAQAVTFAHIKSLYR